MTFPFKLTVAFQLSLTSKPQILLLRLEVKLDYLHPNVMTLVSLLSCKSESSTVPGILVGGCISQGSPEKWNQ